MSTALLICGLMLALGGFVQGTVGFGLALVSVPVLVLVQPDLVPAPLLLIGSVHSMVTMLREHRHVYWAGVGWATLGAVPGTAIGVLLVDSLPLRQFSIVVGTGVLAFAVLSTVSWHPRPTGPALTTAGLASGAFGTAMGIGGPPLVLVLQHEQGPRIRSTMSACFLAGSVLAGTGLVAAGQLDGHDVVSAATLTPFLLAGFLLSGPARRLVTGGRIRYAVLGFAGLSALALIARSVFG